MIITKSERESLTSWATLDSFADKRAHLRRLTWYAITEGGMVRMLLATPHPGINVGLAIGGELGDTLARTDPYTWPMGMSDIIRNARAGSYEDARELYALPIGFQDFMTMEALEETITSSAFGLGGLCRGVEFTLQRELWTDNEYRLTHRDGALSVSIALSMRLGSAIMRHDEAERATLFQIMHVLLNSRLEVLGRFKETVELLASVCREVDDGLDTNSISVCTIASDDTNTDTTGLLCYALAKRALDMNTKYGFCAIDSPLSDYIDAA